MTNHQYHVTFDRRVEIIELHQARRRPASVDEEEESFGCDNDELIVARRYESVEFQEICRDIEEIRLKLEYQSRFNLHHNHDAAIENILPTRRKHRVLHANCSTMKHEEGEDKEACTSPVYKKARPGRGLRRKSLSPGSSRESMSSRKSVDRQSMPPPHSRKECSQQDAFNLGDDLAMTL